MAGLLIFLKHLGVNKAVELPPDATVGDLAAAAGCSAVRLSFQGAKLSDASQLLADAGVCQQSEVNITDREGWRPSDQSIHEAVSIMKYNEWKITPGMETWMSEHHNGQGAPTEFGIEDWDVSSVTNMADLFCDTTTFFNSDLSRWDVSS
eukprot:Hpha_TRINITY_DN16311_c0_g1::TRINITY_DN16311_c0_g1_i1::g.62239::m.62239